MTDRLASLLAHFSISAKTFHAGALCGINSMTGSDGLGQLHLIRQGEVKVMHGSKLVVHINEPSLLLYAQPLARRFLTDKTKGAEFVCADLSFEGGKANPVRAALPAFVCLPLSSLRDSKPVLDLLFAEAAGTNCGRQKMLDSLFEVLLIQILRELMEHHLVQSGMLAGMGHPRLRRALVAMHEQPKRDWSLHDLAVEAGMSRTSFANTFRDVVGVTPVQYLQNWRVGLVQKLLVEGHSMRQIADEVGYSSEAVLSRAFRTQTGTSPREWRKNHEDSCIVLQS